MKRKKARRVMNVRIPILKVLSSYPDGRASYASLKSDLAMLSTGEWLERMKQLGERAGQIDVFREGLATRDGYGWTITPAGREFLGRLERGEEIKRTGVPPHLKVISSNSAVPRPRSFKAVLKLVRSA